MGALHMERFGRFAQLVRVHIGPAMSTTGVERAVDGGLAAPASKWLDEVILLGTGTSGQVPAVHCVTSDESCATCTDAMVPGSKNRRQCTSAVVVGSPPGAPQERSTILIDCGKSFYPSALAAFSKHGLRRIDAVLLTHAHADAMLGLDDLRSWTIGGHIQPYVDVYLTPTCMDTVQTTFPYLIDRSRSTGGGDVGALRWHLIDPEVPSFSVGPHRVPVTPLLVEHGFAGPNRAPFECLGFRIDSMSYISDCHRISDATTQRVAGSDLFILDALKMNRHTSHFSIPQAIDYTLALAQQHPPAPTLTLFTDLTHQTEHYATEEALQQLLAGLRAYAASQSGSAQPRWWAAAWDDAENEASLMLRTRRGLALDASGTPHHPLVPAMHLAYDGQLIQFRKQA